MASDLAAGWRRRERRGRGGAVNAINRAPLLLSTPARPPSKADIEKCGRRILCRRRRTEENHLLDAFAPQSVSRRSGTSAQFPRQKASPSPAPTQPSPSLAPPPRPGCTPPPSPLASRVRAASHRWPPIPPAPPTSSHPPSPGWASPLRSDLFRTAP